MERLRACLIRELVLHFGEDVTRIDHALRVLDHAEALLAETPEADADVVRAAALMHDFGIREAERRHGRCDGPLQEEYGPALVRRALERVGLAPDKTREVCRIVARHHSPPRRARVNFRILYESDWLVNAAEIPAPASNPERVESFIRKNFRTAAGLRRARAVLLGERSIFARMGNVYELMTDERKRRAAEESYLLEMAEGARGAGGGRKRPKAATLVLDLACGTGFHSRLLGRAGYPVVGIDFSRSMLRAARGVAASGAGARSAARGLRIHYQWGDLLQPIAVAPPASLTLLLGNTLSVFQTEDDLRAVLLHAAGATCPRGIVLCQVLNYARLRSLPPAATTRHGKVNGRETVLTKSLQPLDDGTVLLTFAATQHETSRHGRSREWRTSAEATRLRCWSGDEITAAARAAGLELRALWGSMSKSPFDAHESPDCVLQFRRNAGQ